ncbi:MAG: Shikimate kinase [Flavobacterium sp. SCGC AAA160-P02]|nr:MAG: Shikimate kinase [Flavobacterium sp. SCGC AAA160-P02]
MKIVLLGYMGCGKTTIGKKLSNSLYLDFTDLDQYIEKREQKTISEIFNERGEIHYRKIESNYLKEFIDEHDSYVLSLGGGTPCYGKNMEEIMSHRDIISIYLQASIQTLCQRLSKNRSKRPLLSSLSEHQLAEYIGKHLFERIPFYEKARYKVFTNSKDKNTIVTEIRIKLH